MRRIPYLSTALLASFLFVVDTVHGQWTWQNPLPQPNWLNDVVFVDAQTGMAVGESGAVIRTVDGGANWTSRGGDWGDLCSGGIDSVSLLDADTAVVAVRSLCNQPDSFTDASLARTTDGGETWTVEATATNVWLMDLDFFDTSHGTAVGWDVGQGGLPAVMRTTDGGETWTPQSVADVVGVLASVHFTTADSGVAGGFGSVAGGDFGGLILRTVDGGASWSAVFQDASVGWIQDITFVDDDHGVAVGDGGAILTTADGGASWTPRDSGTDRSLQAVSCSDGENCAAAGGGPGDVTGTGAGRVVLRTTDGGVSWTPQLLEEGVASLHGSVLHDPTTLTVVGAFEFPALPYTGGLIWQSTDGGESWSERNRSVTDTTLEAVALPSPQTGIAVGDEGTVLRTLDGGATWSPESSGTTLPLRGVSFVDADVGTVVGGTDGGADGTEGVALRTIDGGATWTATALGNVTLWDVSCTGLEHCTGVGHTEVGGERQRTILRSDDGGATWSPQLTEPGLALLAVSCADVSHCVAVGRDSFDDLSSIVLGTVDGGTNWTPTIIETPNLLRGVHMIDELSGFAVGTRQLNDSSEAIILRTDNGGATWSPVTVPPSAVASGDLRDVVFAGTQSGMIVGRHSTVLITTDGGATWSHEQGEASRALGDLLDVALPTAQRGAIVGTFGQILGFASGQPGSPALELEPTEIDFGDVEVGSSSSPASVTLLNTGDVEITGLTLTLTGEDFSADTSACGDVLGVGEGCPLTVTFTPSLPGPATAVVDASSEQGAGAELGLTGLGVVAGGDFAPAALLVDPSPLTFSDGNGVFEPGEEVGVAPSWRNDGTVADTLSGIASVFVGPPGAEYTIGAAEAGYGSIAPGQTASCLDTEVCYRLGIDDPAARPAEHWDATFDETLDDTDGTTQTWTLHIGESFDDVPATNLFYPAIETLLHSGITGGCTESGAETAGTEAGRFRRREAAGSRSEAAGLRAGRGPVQGGAAYCPGDANSRAQMPVFVLRALMGSDYTPPPCVEDDSPFGDVPFDSPFCPWIQDLADRGIVSGCGDGDYCPGNPVTRAQMAIFLLETLEGADYVPPACTERFTDVPCPSLFADWIEDLATREITGGCSATDFCPGDPVTRGQMAVFVTRTFGLTLYGP